MTTFHSDVVSIYAPAIGRLMPFTDGAYSTDDPAEIRVLRHHSDVTEAQPAAALDSLKREELDDRARTAGVEEPEKLPNKQAVIDAITAAGDDASSD